ncbi:hypothetical protein Tco_1006929 [Tanacetum coccineum]|uniref:Uncharacterized protein n=1 Tax=Tanacetum coccineum TaxID=301880 RepID=A0ABQ5FJ54_9ASTR
MPFSTCSLMKWCRKSMCLDRECWTLLQQREMALRLSQYQGNLLKAKPYFMSCDLIQSIRAQNPDMAMYYASVVEIAVLFCFFDDQLTNLSPRN